MARKIGERRHHGNGLNTSALLLFVIIWTSSVEAISDHESRNACQQFTADKEINNFIEEKRQLIKPCPCIKQKIELDYSFEKDGDCYRQWLFEDGVKQMCCYSSDGNIQIGAPQGGYMLFETSWNNISTVQRSCCLEEASCNMFYKINPSDDCSAYRPPITVTSSGDPTIETIDGNKFDFNGHGEYVFLKTSEIEIQVRLGYVTPGNKDATLFEAFSIYDKNSTESFEVHLNRVKKILEVFRNGTNICNSTWKGPPKPFEFPPRKGHCMVLAGDGKIVIQACGLKTFTRSIVFTAGEFMSIRIVAPKYANMSISGLAGRQKNETFAFRNGTEVGANATASNLFDYGESWSLNNKSESRFNYSITDGNYTFYNGDHTHPKFLEDLVGNLTALFQNYSTENITRFNETCRNYWDHTPNEQCLLTIARSKNYTLGVAVMATANETHHRWEILHNRAPHFLETMPDNITATYKKDLIKTINLTEHVWDDESTSQLNYRVETDLPENEFTLENGVFTWNVSTGLRYIDTSFTFYVIDSLNASESHVVTVQYCGCEDPSECNFDTHNENSSEKVIKAGCECPGYYSGLYCETELDPCKDHNCFHNCSSAFNRSSLSWPCAPCPKGRYDVTVSNEQDCKNVNECVPGYSGKDKCQQNCHDTDGSFSCSCRSGYTLNADNHTCDDIDECKDKHNCFQTEICMNTDGGYKCNCAPEYSRQTDGDKCIPIVGASYVGSISFTVAIKEVGKDINKTLNTAKNKESFRILLDAIFNGTEGYQSVEVVKVILIPQSGRHKRRANGQSFEMKGTYVVHWTETKNNTQITTYLQDSFKKNAPNHKLLRIEGVSLSNFSIDLLGGNLYVNSVNEAGLCSISNRTDCDLESTVCKNVDGGFECRCKTGYLPAKLNHKYCKDVNECGNFNEKEKEARCVHGACVNTIGSWNCSCPVDRQWQNVGNDTYLKYRCQGNYSYIGSIDVHQTGNQTIKDFNKFVAKTINGFFENSSIEVKKYAVPIKSLMVVVSVFDVISENQTNRAVFNIRMGEMVEISNISSVFQEAVPKNVTQDNVTVMFNNYYIFNDSENMLCTLSNNGNCDLASTECKQYNGDTHCNCKSGFNKSLPAERFCRDYNECNDISKNNCSGHGKCRNIPGGYTCDCDNGYAKNDSDPWNIECQDIDECISKDYTCDGGQCNNTIGSWNCACNSSGFIRKNIPTGFLCTDIDECSNKSYVCKNGKCENTVGNWSCTCPNGYRRNETSSLHTSFQCKEINECDEFNNNGTMKNHCIHGTCVNSPGSWNCSCPADKKWQKIRNVSSYAVYRCQGDYQYIGEVKLVWNNLSVNSSRVRDFLNETVTSIFSRNENVNTSIQNGSLRMEDIFLSVEYLNETSTNHTAGGYITISALYILHLGESVAPKTVENFQSLAFSEYNIQTWKVTVTKSKILDESGANLCNIPNKTECDPISTNCTVHNGSYSCTCKSGFPVRIDDHNCKDIDECEQKHVVCQSGVCRNTIGSWKCSCNKTSTFKMVNHSYGICEDIDECNDTNYQCHSGNCSNRVGGWNCTCETGYYAEEIVPNKIYTCSDINECNGNLNDSCTHGGVCSNTQGNWTCECLPGFEVHYINESFIDCKDIDECQSEEYSCEGDNNSSHCNNTVGGWKCECSVGYTPKNVSDTARICDGDYQYVASVSFTFTGEITNIISIKKAIKEKIEKMYEAAFKDNSNIWIEILEITGLPGASRKRRSALNNIKAKYIVHSREEKSEEELKNVEAVYKNTKCDDQRKTCSDEIAGYPVEFLEMWIENRSAICNTSANICDDKKSYCKSDNGQVNCHCKQGYEKRDDKPQLCEDINECLTNKNTACQSPSTCINKIGTWDCTCEKGLRAFETSNGTKECKDVCEHSKCYKTSTCTHDSNEDGYVCGCAKGRTGTYCNDIDHEYKESKQQTTLIAVGSSLGGLVLILAAVIFGVCRWRATEVKEAEKISMRHMDSNGFKTFDGLFNTNQYIKDSRDGSESVHSHRLSNALMPNAYPNDDTNISEYKYAKPQKPPKPNFRGSMPNLAKVDANVYRSDNRRLSDQYSRWFSSYEQGLNTSFNDLTHFNGRASPTPDYGRPRSPKPDYRRSYNAIRPRIPRPDFRRSYDASRPIIPSPDYHRREFHDASKDSGMGNGNSNDSKGYRRPDHGGGFSYTHGHISSRF